MTEYIKREDVLALSHYDDHDCEIVDIKDVERLPSADVVERKRGEWYDRGSMSCRCSNCGCKANKEYSFCPNCGADMRGEKCGLQPLKMFEKCGYPKEGERREDDQDI